MFNGIIIGVLMFIIVILVNGMFKFMLFKYNLFWIEMIFINENLCYWNKFYNIWKDENKFIRCFIFYFWVKGVWYWLVVGIIVINGVLFSVLFFMVLVGF